MKFKIFYLVFSLLVLNASIPLSEAYADSAIPTLKAAGSKNISSFADPIFEAVDDLQVKIRVVGGFVALLGFAFTLKASFIGAFMFLGMGMALALAPQMATKVMQSVDRQYLFKGN